jgi:hypothetical protein
MALLDPAARADVGDPAAAIVGGRYRGSVHDGEGSALVGLGVWYGYEWEYANGSRGGSAGQRAINAPDHGRVWRKDRRCGSAEGMEWMKEW